MNDDRLDDDFRDGFEQDLVEVDERLADFVDGRLSERDRERFAAELRVSPRLREQLEQYQRAVATVQQALRAPTLPTQLADRVMAALAREAARPSLVRRKLRPFLFAAASAAALLTLAVMVDRLGAPPSAKRSQTASAPSAEEVVDERETSVATARRPADVREQAEVLGASQGDGQPGEADADRARAELLQLELSSGLRDAREPPAASVAPASEAGEPEVGEPEVGEVDKPDVGAPEASKAGADKTDELRHDDAVAPGAGGGARAPRDGDEAKPGDGARGRGGRRGGAPLVEAPMPSGGGERAGNAPDGGTNAPDARAPAPPAAQPRSPGGVRGPSTDGPAGPGAPTPSGEQPGEQREAVPSAARDDANGAVTGAVDGHRGDEREVRGEEERPAARKAAGGGKAKDGPDKSADPAARPSTAVVTVAVEPALRFAARGERASRVPVVTIEIRGAVEKSVEALRRRVDDGRDQGAAVTGSQPVADLLAAFVAAEFVALEAERRSQPADLAEAARLPASRRFDGLQLHPLSGAPAGGGADDSGGATRDWLVLGPAVELERLMREVARYSAARGGRLSTGETGVAGVGEVAPLGAEGGVEAGGEPSPRCIVLRFRSR